MKLHEYQAKDIFRKSGIPIPNGELVTAVEQATKVTRIINGPPWIIKAQIHAGGRGKAGGIRRAHYPYEVVTEVESMLGKTLMTAQTGSDGIVVRQVLVEEGIEIDREFYLGMVIDRAVARPVMILSQAGGVEIEEIASRDPQLIAKEHVEISAGWMPHQARNLIYRLDPLPTPELIRSMAAVMQDVYEVFTTLDCSLLEINPLVISKNGKLLAVDAKINIDDNALFRHTELLRLDDPREKDSLELMAEKYHLNYIRLDGTVGVMVNGAGLAMATMDVIKMAGAAPANFLDVGGGASEEMITKGFEIILKDTRVKTILINIFGGILRCDVLARGVIAAAEKIHINVPLIVRLEGTNVKEGREILANSGLEFIVAKDLSEAAENIAKETEK
jgi:succinyl-CoA synthetase beta subunit